MGKWTKNQPGESMPPKLDKQATTERVHLVASRALLDEIEEWRSTRKPVPNMSEAIRRLIVRGLKGFQEDEASAPGERND